MIGLCIINLLAALFTPEVLVEEMGGMITPTVKIWVRAASSGYALVVFLCIYALYSEYESPIRVLVLRSIAFHTVVHTGGIMLGQLAENETKGMLTNLSFMGLAIFSALYFEVPPSALERFKQKED